MNSILELQRKAHEEIERVEEATVQELLTKPKAHKEKLVQEHRVKTFVERVQQRSQYLLDLYQDVDGSRKAEIDAITGASDFGEFYARLRDIKDYHRRYPHAAVEPMELEFQERDLEKEEEELEKMFSGEEALGKYLDMHEAFDQYVNLEKVNKVNYLKYLDQFQKFESIPREIKSSPAYATYLQTLQTYLESFFERSQPLFDLRETRQGVMATFEPSWEAGTVVGWRQDGAMEIDQNAELFCPACNKQFSKKSVYTAHLTGKKHKKAASALLEKGVTEISPEEKKKARLAKEKEERDKMKPIAMAEQLVKEYVSILSAQRDETKAHVERKQTLTTEELVADAVEEIELSEEEEEEEEKIYNPLKLPLGWDGKPIPYWLYKLHGLGVEYPCEICGNFVYMGRKAFDRHFQEWRHAHGMRCLGIPNTRHFHEITLIEDAYALWERLKQGSKTEQFRADLMEEFEDADGNVFNKKTYDDLKRQGLL
ncbi:SF3a splicing factor complex subunit PRP9 [Spizellomyces punctatus DAOM BR117]|uniref:Matrin-type domain-containing protein n=1 Tax=Spizellomyces punctatus (strain DAOM BR117) TaxID=645134 RepID=A0A0L0HJG3_SPIPD|nr:SF3a splicing factor complex subunit PRP9 [Spizellomyces punctatus DAOM BR117]KND01586.1 hypothetical protein SPPG_03383 [Spizellomyces punctatus DAOM BR117]|eukprot:XP_016609625.1 hypothetical protein SPPG_03383 [Spizellomyces punctatus DAOM BR117]